MYKGIFFIILWLNILIFSIFVSYRVINRLNNTSGGIFSHFVVNNSIGGDGVKNEVKGSDIRGADIGGGGYYNNYLVMDALAIISSYDYEFIKDLLEKWDNEVKVYDSLSGDVKYSVLVFPGNGEDINKFIGRVNNSLGIIAKLDDNSINLGLFNNKEEAQKLKEKVLSYGFDVGIMKIYDGDNLSAHKSIIYFKGIDYLDFYEIVKILGSFAVLEPIRVIN